MTRPLTPMTIGAFSRATRLSAKALRLYGDLGLLPPAQVDDQTGYRFYLPAQLETARLIGLLRGLHMPLTTIRAVLDAPVGARTTLVRGYWNAAEQQHHARCALARYVLTTLEGGTPMTGTFTVHTREQPVRQLATLQRRVFQPELDGFLAPSIARLTGSCPPGGRAHRTAVRDLPRCRDCRQ